MAQSPWPLFVVAVAAAWVALLRGHLSSQAHPASAVTTLAMWALMATAMMAPTAVPVLASLGELLGTGHRRNWWSFLGGYLAVWLAFATAATVAQVLLSRLDVIRHDGASGSPWFSAGLLGAAGLYQLTSWKRRCATECVAPMTFFLRHWRDGMVGAARMGVRHGLSCVGCCWALMLLAFVGGVSNIWFMVLGAGLMGLEKLPAVGARLTIPLGVLLLAAGAIVAITGADGPRATPHHQSTPVEGKETDGQVVPGG